MPEANEGLERDIPLFGLPSERIGVTVTVNLGDLASRSIDVNEAIHEQLSLASEASYNPELIEMRELDGQPVAIVTGATLSAYTDRTRGDSKVGNLIWQRIHRASKSTEPGPNNELLRSFLWFNPESDEAEGVIADRLPDMIHKLRHWELDIQEISAFRIGILDNYSRAMVLTAA